MRQLSSGHATRRAARSLPLLGWVLLGLGCSGEQGGSRPESLGARPAALAPAERCELPSAGYSADCNTCLAARCCEPLEACKGDAQCAEQLACEVQCQYDVDPPACSARCFAAGPHRLYTPYDDCSFAECRASCWL